MQCRHQQNVFSENRDLIALIKNLEEELFTRIAAMMQLSPETTQEVMLYSNIVGQKGHAGQDCERRSFARDLRVDLQSFLKIQQNGVVLYSGSAVSHSSIDGSILHCMDLVCWFRGIGNSLSCVDEKKTEVTVSMAFNKMLSLKIDSDFSHPG
jgi:hypothetical protein